MVTTNLFVIVMDFLMTSPNSFPIEYEDTPDGFTVARRPLGVRLFAYADRNWSDARYTKNALRRYQRGYVVDFVIHMDLQFIIVEASHHLNLTTVLYERDMAGFLGYANAIDRIIRQAQPTHILHFTDVLDNDESVYLQKKAKIEQIQYEVVKHP